MREKPYIEFWDIRKELIPIIILVLEDMNYKGVTIAKILGMTENHYRKFKSVSLEYKYNKNLTRKIRTPREYLKIIIQNLQLVLDLPFSILGDLETSDPEPLPDSNIIESTTNNLDPKIKLTKTYTNNYEQRINNRPLEEEEEQKEIIPRTESTPEKDITPPIQKEPLPNSSTPELIEKPLPNSSTPELIEKPLPNSSTPEPIIPKILPSTPTLSLDYLENTSIKIIDREDLRYWCRKLKLSPSGTKTKMKKILIKELKKGEK